MTRVTDDDEAEIEAEIRRELEALGDDSLELLDLEEDENPSITEKTEDDFMPDSLKEYLRFVQSRTEGVEAEVKECDSILQTQPQVVNDDEQLAKRIKENLYGDCDDPLALRNKVLIEIEEAELNEQKERSEKEHRTEDMAIDIIRTDLTKDVRALEEQAQEKLRELEDKQAVKDKQRQNLYEEMKREEDSRKCKDEEVRKQRQVELENAQRKLDEEKQAKQAMLENEFQKKEKKIHLMEEKFQFELKIFEEEQEKQQQVFQEMQAREADYQRQRQQEAAVKLQKHYRGYRARMQFKPVLEEKRRDRQNKRKDELDRIERVEQKIREKQEKKKQEEEQMKKLEEKRREEEKQRKEAERRNKEQEEQRRREEIEKRRLEEEEKKRKEDERIKEEEKKKREQEEQKKREEERKNKEQEEQRRREEVEKRRLEEEEKKRKERRKEEEKKKREQEEQKKREEEKARRLKEEEERKSEEDRRRKEEEQKRLEEEERRRKEEDRTRLEEEKREQERRKEEDIRIKEEEWNKRKEEFDKRLKDEEERKKKCEVDKVFSEGSGLTGDVEEQRKLWIKEHTPWSTLTLEERTQPFARSKPRRAFSASKHLPVLTEEQILQASPPQTPLYKVALVRVENIPSCTMQGFHRCPSVKSVTLENCGLLAVEGLEQCKQLRELKVQNNKIEAMNCRDLCELEELAVCNNSLTSIQGLDGCTGLRSLDLKNNKITRIGDLSSCRKLQSLHLDHNQLIITKGLSNLPRLQHLSCAHNHLPHVKDIDKCVLLHSINLQANNLQEPPLLMNHVLLRELTLDDNSISSLSPLCRAWLPLLQFLSVSQNSISTVDSLEGLVMLEVLDLSHNLISDTESLFPGISGCKKLQALNIEGNPVHEEPNCRKHIIEGLPSLKELDSVCVRNEPVNQDTGSFVALCNQQIERQNEMKSRHQKEIKNVGLDSHDSDVLITALKTKSRHYEECFQLALDQLHEHENFTPEGYPRANELGMNIKSAQERQEKLAAVSSDSRRHKAATLIQALWRGWHLRHRIDVQTRRWMAAVTIQSTWRGHWVRSLIRERSAVWEGRHHAAATSIQACYRGYRVRRRLTEALKLAQYYDSDEQDEFDYDEEVDLAAFDFDVNELEEGWTPTDTPQLPSRGPVLTSSHIHKPKTETGPDVPWPTRQAWRSIDSPVTNIRAAIKPTLGAANVSMAMAEQDQMSVTSGAQSHLSRKAEELNNEWGFKNADTAERIMQRARKMKYNPARRKKLLDPSKRLALFKRLEEANKLRDVKPPPRRQPANRVEYFAAREAMSLPSGAPTPTCEREAKAEMTYSWVYKQAVIHQDEEENLMSGRKEYVSGDKPPRKSPQKLFNKSPVNLPQMSAIALSGRNVPLVSSPLFHSVAEETNSSVDHTRRHSLSSESVRFPPLKTYSVPNLTVRSREGGETLPEKSNSAGARISKDKRGKRR